MKRWNGWGDERITYPLSLAAKADLERAVGPGLKTPDARLEQILDRIPSSRLRAHSGIHTDRQTRLLHARGQSLPDWIALRSGMVAVFPDGVAFPEDDQQVRSMLEMAAETGARLIPYGGGTSVVGHINPRQDDRPVVTLDLSRLGRILELDEISRLATFQAGASGPWIESQLAERGYTLGHYPQSWEYSTLGGWIATRSSGQQSCYYGRIEDLFAGGHLETPTGAFKLFPHPASAAGPDLRHLVLGSEGRLGVITRAVVRIRPRPSFERFEAAFLPDWETGLIAVRTIAQAEAGLSMLRLSDARETATTLAMAGRDRLVSIGDRALRFLGKGEGRCLLIYGLTGERRVATRAGRTARRLLRGHGGLPVGSLIGESWRKDRFRTPYLRNTLWELGYALDTLETAAPWSKVQGLTETVRGALQSGLESESERVLVLAHLSHQYPDGASLYFTYLFRKSPDPDQTLARWNSLKYSASKAILTGGGTISHQHGIGLDHAPFMETEKGRAGLHLLRAAVQSLDPEGILNPGKLIDDETQRLA